MGSNVLKYSILLVLIGFSSQLKAAYSIRGKINWSDQWQPKIYMAAVEKLSDYYHVSPDLIVNIADVNEQGEFTLKGDNLPSDPRFYRLYLMKTFNNDYDACSYIGGDDHNFIHIIMDNHTNLDVLATAIGAPFQDYEILGNEDNELMKQLATLVYPSFYFYQIRFPTELKFSEKKLHSDLKNFVDTCQSTLVSLAAINHTDFDEYYEKDELFYKAFGARLERELPASDYTINYFRKLRYYSDEVVEVLPTWASWLLGFLTMLVLSLGLWNLNLHRRIRGLSVIEEKEEETIDPRSKLTRKEREILDLMLADKSNKEIASDLFVELSTVKTHINKIYSKLNLKNRGDLKKIENLRSKEQV